MPDTLTVNQIFWLFGTAFAVSNAVIGVMHKTLRDDNAVLRETLTNQAAAFEAKLALKADAIELERRRLEALRIFDEIARVERTLTDNFHNFKTELLVKLAELKGENNASHTRSH